MSLLFKGLRPYAFALLLLASILLGAVAGRFFPEQTPYLKPLGDIFLNLIFTTIVPLVFFSVSSAIARIGAAGKLGKTMGSMMLVFLLMSILAAAYALVIVVLFPPAQGVHLSLPLKEKPAANGIVTQLAAIATVPDFSQLLTHKNMFALLVFAFLVGLAVSASQEKGKPFAQFLHAGEAVFLRVFDFIMYYAPLGFFAYFAVLVNELGATLIESYLRMTVVYYVAVILYFIVAYTLFAYIADHAAGIKRFWRTIFLPMTTAIATCSSAASIPANLVACKKMGVAAEISETVIPLGTLIHKEGSIIGGVFKIAFLFGIFHLPFTGFSVLLTALGVSILVGTVMGAIPSGGMLGELLILSVYGFPPSVLIAIAAISIIIDPIATMLNVTGNTSSSLLIDSYLSTPCTAANKTA